MNELWAVYSTNDCILDHATALVIKLDQIEEVLKIGLVEVHLLFAVTVEYACPLWYTCLIFSFVVIIIACVNFSYVLPIEFYSICFCPMTLGTVTDILIFVSINHTEQNWARKKGKMEVNAKCNMCEKWHCFSKTCWCKYCVFQVYLLKTRTTRN